MNYDNFLVYKKGLFGQVKERRRSYSLDTIKVHQMLKENSKFTLKLRSVEIVGSLKVNCVRMKTQIDLCFGPRSAPPLTFL